MGAKRKNRTTFIKTIRNSYKTHPIIAFTSFLVLLGILVVTSNMLQKPKDDGEIDSLPVEVEVFKLSEPLRISVQGRVEKSGIYTVTSLAPGVVSNIHVNEGQIIYPGKTILSLAQNHTGGNAVSIQRLIAQKQYESIQNTFDIQKELIAKQREAAEKVDDNTDELLTIANDSIGETKEVLSLTDEVINDLENTLSYLEANNTNNQNAEQILTIKQALSQAKSGAIQLRGTIRNLEYQVDTGKPPAELSDIQRDIAIKGLELQEKGLHLSREMAELGVRAAKIAESAFYPSTPIKGVVEKVHVIKNQSIAPGMPIATIKASNNDINISANISEQVVQLISKESNAQIVLGSEKYDVNPTYISSIPTNGTLYTINFSIKNPGNYIPTNSFVLISLELNTNCKTNNVCLIPVSAINQNQESTTLFVALDGAAKLKETNISSIIGNYVQVTKGLTVDDIVITTRNVVDGDRVRAL